MDFWQDQQWKSTELQHLLVCTVEVTELAVGAGGLVGLGKTSESGAFLSTTVLFRISLMAVAGQGVAGGGSISVGFL